MNTGSSKAAALPSDPRRSIAQVQKALADARFDAALSCAEDLLALRSGIRTLERAFAQAQRLDLLIELIWKNRGTALRNLSDVMDFSRMCSGGTRHEARLGELKVWLLADETPPVDFYHTDHLSRSKAVAGWMRDLFRVKYKGLGRIRARKLCRTRGGAGGSVQNAGSSSARRLREGRRTHRAVLSGMGARGFRRPKLRPCLSGREHRRQDFFAKAATPMTNTCADFSAASTTACGRSSTRSAARPCFAPSIRLAAWSSAPSITMARSWRFLFSRRSCRTTTSCTWRNSSSARTVRCRAAIAARPSGPSRP